MDRSERRWSLLYLGIALLLVVALFAGADGSVPLWRYLAVALAAVFFAASAVPRVREHPAHTPLEYGVIAGVFAAQAVDSGSVVVAALAALMTLGTLVELYNWRTGSTLLRMD